MKSLMNLTSISDQTYYIVWNTITVLCGKMYAMLIVHYDIMMNVVHNVIIIDYFALLLRYNVLILDSYGVPLHSISIV